ncbi:ABC transporter substrate-binding protein [Ruminococcus gauvreauii]|uniref:ABC transporter substrate-binding protein n=1 Tax=Ruminococcus gauvreauii TaxID=438033 RepID=A0ABY5VF72_9FIRM|nr:ABC transporter substrate-binding protein [Ruminococcus gauvreauii]UWP58535.1 ABC transporter substrate-binding protein [Ruminococcus gauvreauii]
MYKWMKKTMGLALASLIGISLLAGCQKSESAAKGSAASGQEASGQTASGGEVTIGVTSFADTLEPTEQYFSWVVTRYGVGETLAKFDENGEIVPCLAKEWSVSEDQLTWTFKIREGVKFSNGNDMTPEAVKASLERTFELSDRAATFFDPESIEVDGQNLLIRTKDPVAVVPGSLADPLFLIVDTTADTDSFAMSGPICTGPYAVESFNPTDSCIVVKNEYYWDGEVPLDKVTLKCIDDQTTRSMALQTGEIDIAYNLKTENIADFEGDESIEIQKLQSLRSTYAFMNQNGVLGDIRLRQAIIRGLDKETYCSTLLEGGATPGKAPVPPTLDFGFDELQDENAYDPEGAKALLAEAGYEDLDGDGFVETPEGEVLDLNFVIYTSREELNVYAQAAQASLKDIGIKVTLNTVSYETLLDMRDSGDFDMLIWNVLVANTGDPEKYLRENWHSTSASNQTGYLNPEVDSLLDQLAAEFDEDARKDLTIQIQQLIMDDASTVFFGYETTYLFSNSRVTGVTMYPMDYYWLTKDIALAE